ncbi:MAG: Xaa-Pro dipeptidase [Acidobacteriota bacterium]
MSIETLFAEHIATLNKRYAEAIESLKKDGVAIDAILIHSGSETAYYADDHIVSFKAFGHFNQWAPVNRPDQLVLIEPGKRTIYYQVVPKDYWYDQSVHTEEWWARQFEVVELASADELFDQLPPRRRIAFVGQNTEYAGRMGLPSMLHNHRGLLSRLDWQRGIKTEYEVARMREANVLARRGYAAAQAAFERGGDEWTIHTAFLLACGITDEETAFPSIVAIDEKSAILHYQHKRRGMGSAGRVALIDAGCRVEAYCSDTTRTYTSDRAHPVFRSLVAGMDRLQLELVGYLRPNQPYLELHEEAHRRVTALLREVGICSASEDEMRAQKVSHIFFPHGIGHLLGIQVHDVGGRMKDPSGEPAPPPPEHPFLRLTRQVEPGMVFTIEPGIYFIPTLLDPERDGNRGRLLNWKLIDELIPFGGIRFEDDVVVTASGCENLTR